MQHHDPRLRLRVAAGRVQPREVGMADDLHQAARRELADPLGERVQPELARGRLGARPVGRRLVQLGQRRLRRPSSRCAGRAAGRRRPARSGRRRAPPRASRTARAASAADFGPTPLRARDPVGRVAAQRDEVRHLRRVDAVALAHLGRARPARARSPRAPAGAPSRARSRAGTRRGPRSTTVTGPGQRAAAAARKSSASYPPALRGDEPERLDERRAARRAARGSRRRRRARPGSPGRRLVAVGRHVERVPRRRPPPPAAPPPTAEGGSSRTRRARRPAGRPRRLIDFGSAW